ncbi:MAG: single-stranded DNA-binding protein [Alphaproteobacteria bacterium]|jgi:single-strand DNA-binding protein|nr:single-stranded DNA-binding protein [Alphaproteobacteria bacterium]
MVNKVILIGNVGGDPEIRFSQSGSKIATFSLATSEYWKDKATGERKSKSEWHRIVIFNENLAGIVESYVKKGSKIFVEGSIQSRKYTDNNGVERNITEVVLTQFKGEIQLLDSRGGGGDSGGDYSQSSSSSSFSQSSSSSSSSSKKNEDFSTIGDDLDDEIPF